MGFGVSPSNAAQRREQSRELATRSNESGRAGVLQGKIKTVFDAGYFANGGAWPNKARALLFKELERTRGQASKLGLLVVEVELPKRDKSTTEKRLFFVLKGNFENGNGSHLVGRPVDVKVSPHGGYERDAELLPPHRVQYDPVAANAVASIGGII